MKIKWLSKDTVDNTSYISKPELSLYNHNVSTVMVLKYRVFSFSSLKTPASLLYEKRQRSVSKKELLNTFKQKFWGRSVLQGLFTKQFAYSALKGLYAFFLLASKKINYKYLLF